MKNKKWTTTDIPSQAGRRVVITGANSGIGFHSALELARRGAEIILPARTDAKAADAIARIRSEVPRAQLVPAIVDLSVLASVRAFAAFFTERFPGQSLDLLINNAGVMAIPKREITPDGFERQFATNYIGPFALTGLLLAHLKPVPGTRVVTVASTAANMGKIDFDNLQSAKRYSPMWGAYAQSKLADLIFAMELQRRFTTIGSPIVSTAAHPGFAITNLQTAGPGTSGSWGMRLAMAILKPVASQDACQGALPTLYAATSPDVVPGGYYGPDGFFEMKGSPVPAKIAAAAMDIELSKRLWAESERLSGVSFDN